MNPKKDRLRVNCKAFFTWVGDGVGGLLGGDNAYRKLTLKHHADKVKRSMKVALKVSISWKTVYFQEPLNAQPACSRLLFFFQENGPWIIGGPERPTGVLKAFSLGKMALWFSGGPESPKGTLKAGFSQEMTPREKRALKNTFRLP